MAVKEDEELHFQSYHIIIFKCLVSLKKQGHTKKVWTI